MDIFYLSPIDPLDIGFNEREEFVEFAESHQQYCRQLTERGHKATYSYFGDSFEKYTHPQASHKIIEFPTTVELLYGSKFSVALLKYLASRRPDIVHIHSLTVHTVIPIILLCWLLRLPLVLQHHGDVPESRRQWIQVRALNPFLRTLPSAVLSVNKRSADRFKKIGLPNVAFLPNGVDVEEYTPEDASEARLELDVSSESTHLLYVGRLTKKKGVEYLLGAFDELLNRKKNIFLDIVFGGYDDQTLERVRRLIIERNLSGSVRLAERVDTETLYKYYHSADICVQPSLREGFGVVPLEAMASQTPVVLTDAHIEAGHTVTDGKEGSIVSPACTDELVKVLEPMICDDSRRDEMGVSARRLVVENYDWSEITDSLSQTYRELLQ